jgi:phosphoribosyl 1,2-cyclic phosphodiesterase
VLKVKFWGVRGSVPTPLSTPELEGKIEVALLKAKPLDLKTPAAVRRFVKGLSAAERGTYGGNTACVSVSDGTDTVVLDAGSGLRELGRDLAADRVSFKSRPLHVFISHFHWDHILGFPFFAPSFVPGNQVTIYSPAFRAKKFFKIQHGDPFFPVELEHLGATLRFRTIHAAQRRQIGAFQISAVELAHPGGGLGYRLDSPDGSLVYLTDTEIEQASLAQTRRYLQFVQGADMAIVDAQYSVLETVEKRTWGHSSVFRFIDLFREARLKTLVMFHYDPSNVDAEIDDLQARARRYLRTVHPHPSFDVVAAMEGLELEVGR